MSDQQEITRVIEQYIAGGVAGDSKLMAGAFHADATIYGVADGRVEGGPIQILFDAIEGAPAPKLTGVVGAIELNGTTATATAVLNDWSGINYTDQFTLLKDNGSWKLLNKVYFDRG